MDKIITFAYAYTNLSAYALQPIPNTNQCMTKAMVNAYLSVDQAPLVSYADNRLVPINRVNGVSIGFPTDITYFVFSDKDKNLTFINGTNEYNRINSQVTSTGYYNPIQYRNSITRVSDSDPSFNAEFFFDNAVNEPIRAIVKDIFNKLQLTGDAQIKRTILKMNDDPVDYAGTCMMSAPNGNTPSTVWMDMLLSTPPTINPLSNMGYMVFPTTDLSGTSYYNQVGPRNALNISNTTYPGTFDNCYHFTREITNQHTDDNGFPVGNYWDVYYKFNKFEVDMELIKNGVLLQSFKIVWFP